MYVNKCTKCGSEFETKNPKRVICPNCLYPEKKMSLSSDLNDGDSQGQEQKPQQNSYQAQPEESETPKPPQQFYNSYSQEPPQQRPYNNRPQQGGYNQNQGGGYNRPQQGGYNRPPQQGGYNNQGGGGYNRPQQGGYNRPPQQGGYQSQGGGYNRPQQGGYNRPPQQGGYNNQGGGGYNRPQQGGYNRPPQQGNRFGGNRSFPPRTNKPLLVNRDQLEQIEIFYKAMLPLPNPDAHEVIGAKIELEPRKVFFGINLIRQKMMLPKLPFPKRKLAISPDQMFAIQNLYEPLLPLPPIGCHKIIAAQLKMDEWRVHVGIGLVRTKLGLERWNQERDDAPEEFKKTKTEDKKVKKVKEPKEKKAKEPKEAKEAKAPKEPKEAKPKKPKKTKAEASEEVAE